MATKKKSDIPALLRALKKYYSDATCELNFTNPLELLVATILSAQCTDKRVNLVTQELFKKFRVAKDYAEASPDELEKIIRSTGFYRNKAKNIKEMARRLVSDFGGHVPDSMDDLLSLAGVARKTANVVMGNAFGKADGVVVDTHVIRLSQRLGLSKNKTPEKIEIDLMKQVPQKDWIWISHALIWHGRRVCMARNPQCATCLMRKNCANPAF